MLVAQRKEKPIEQKGSAAEGVTCWIPVFRNSFIRSFKHHKLVLAMTIYKLAGILTSLISHCSSLQHWQFFLLCFLQSHDEGEMKKGGTCP